MMKRKPFVVSREIFFILLAGCLPLISVGQSGFEDASGESEKLVTRVFEVPLTLEFLLHEKLENHSADRSPASDQNSGNPFDDAGIRDPFEVPNSNHHFEDTFRRIFRIEGNHLGLPIGPHGRVNFDAEAGTLAVRDTPDQIEKVEAVISSLPEVSFEEERAMVSAIIRGAEIPTEMIKDPQVELVKEKLESIRIPELHLQKVAFKDALNQIQQLGVEFDRDPNPARRGISMIVEVGPEIGKALEEGDFFREVSGSSEKLDAVLTLHLTGVSLGEALRECAQQAGYRYAVQAHAVVFQPVSVVPEELKTVRFLLPPKIYKKLVSLQEGFADPFAPPVEQMQDVEEEWTVKDAIESFGVTFPYGSDARYDSSKKFLYVTNVPSQIELVVCLLRSLDDGKVILRYDSRFHRPGDKN